METLVVPVYAVYAQVAALIVALIAMAVSMKRLFGKYEDLLDDKRTLESTHDGAMEMVEEAKQRAKKIVEESEAFSEEFSKQMREGMTRASKEAVAEFKGVIKAIADEAGTGINGVSRKLEDELGKLISEEKTRATEAVAKYEKAQIAQIENQVLVLTQKMATKVLGGAIDSRKHEELVMKALAEAKVKGVLGETE